jgi:hypothetical protein
LAAAAVLTFPIAAFAADNQTPDEQAHASGKVIVQSVGPGVPVNPATPPLTLSDDQRARIRSARLTKARSRSSRRSMRRFRRVSKARRFRSR